MFDFSNLKKQPDFNYTTNKEVTAKIKFKKRNKVDVEQFCALKPKALDLKSLLKKKLKKQKDSGKHQKEMSNFDMYLNCFSDTLSDEYLT